MEYINWKKAIKNTRNQNTSVKLKHRSVFFVVKLCLQQNMYKTETNLDLMEPCQEIFFEYDNHNVAFACGSVLFRVM